MSSFNDTNAQLEATISRLITCLEQTNDRLDQALTKIDRMEKRIEELTGDRPEWLTQEEAVEHFGWSISSLQRWRNHERLTEGLHWMRDATGKVIYNRALMEDWRINQRDPAAHQRAIDEWSKAQSKKMRKAS